jgi:hypothetical protein
MMPDRLVRDELLTSERYWRCSPEARCLYISLLLSVDDAARYTGAPFALRTRCMAGTVSHERIDAILAELVDCDLVRRYIDNNKPYLFVPRFRNRRRYIASSQYPEPPSEINDIVLKKSALSQPQVNPESASSQPQVRRGRGRGRGGVGEEQTPLASNEKKLSFSAEDGWVNLMDQDRRVWALAYPAVDLDAELAKARAWVLANPKNRKSNWRRFLANWFGRVQDKAPALGGGKTYGKVL